LDSGKQTAQVTVLPPAGKPMVPGGYFEYRSRLIEKYHSGAAGIVDKLRQAGRDDAASLLVALIDEVLKETDHLLGNELVATENGELRDASVISFKRAEVLEKAIKAVQTKQQFDAEHGIDIDSPMMMAVMRFFMSKVKETFDRINIKDEQSDLFFKTFADVMHEWKKQLKLEIEGLKAGK
jgi:hypothetical protein